ncbi:MAG TPA: TonB-dependent receptor, partial [Longimicrobiaceae bacterium]|nr:TonB-dependent receptor [Longimicrobiaceae bacterium]
ALLSPARPAPAQERGTGETRPTPVSISGSVLDARTTLPLTGARVSLRPLDSGALPVRQPRGSGPAGRLLSAATDGAGRYTLPGLRPGRYRLDVHLLGYRPATMDVQLRDGAPFELSVGMQVEPIVLEPVRVTADEAESYGRTRSYAPGAGFRVAAERLRQRRYLESDVRSISHADVEESVTLGEPDLFRALQRLPGVTSRDDYSAEVWTRGARWDHTQVLFDGVPLFNPLHAAGGFSGVNPDALAGVLFLPGVQPVEHASSVAGVVDLRSRPGGGPGQVRALADASLVSARVALDQSVLGGRGSWMLSARRSHVDLLTRGIDALRDRSVPRVPYAFSDVVGRFDLHLGEGWKLEASGLRGSDRLDGTVDEVVEASRARWGNHAGRITLVAPFRGGRARHTVGGSRFAARADVDGLPPELLHPAYGRPVNREDTYRAQPLRSSVSYSYLEGAWEAAPDSAGITRWSAGYRLVSQGADFRIEGLWPYRSDPAALTSRRDVSYGVVWGNRAWTPIPELRLEAGVRAEVGGGIRGTGPARLAPRLSARFQATPGLGISAALGRAFQYAQAIVPTGPGINPVALSGILWGVADDEFPAARTDIVTVGAERWLGDAVLASATLYGRHTIGAALPDPTPGALRDRPLFVPGEGRARGMEISLRKLDGPWTGSLAYSYASSHLKAEGRRYRAPWGRHHALDATFMGRVTRSLRVGAAYTTTSGTARTLYFEGFARCEEGGECAWRTYPTAGPPSSRTTPGYSSLDLLADWSRSFGSWGVGAYVQVRNLWNRANPAAYVSNDLIVSSPFCVYQQAGTSWECSRWYVDQAVMQHTDRWLPGLRRVPLLGLRITF